MADDLDRLRAEYERRDAAAGAAARYSLFNPGHLFLVQRRQRAVLKILRRERCAPLGDRRVLEVGCGAGGVLAEFLGFGAAPGRLHGVDLLSWRLAKARRVYPNFPLVCADGQQLPYRSGSFDVVMQYTAFSSILDDRIKERIAGEMLRVLKPDGLILWYDYWLNPLNPQARGIGRRELGRLFPGCRRRVLRITLAPPVARRLARASWLACEVLELLRVLNTHDLAAIRPWPAAAAPLGGPLAGASTSL